MEVLKNIFLYSKDTPLIFTSLYFWIFFAIVFGIFSAMYKKRTIKHTYLFLVSLFFYWKTSGFYLILLILTSLIDFKIGNMIFKTDVTNKRKRNILLFISLFSNLGLLVYYKYAYFFVDSINAMFDTHFIVVDLFAKWMNDLTGTHFTIDKIFLPVGISFFTFQTLSYTIDIYRNKLTPVKSVVDFGFFVSFFPQLVAGPIVRASEFIPQLYEDFKLTKADFGKAIFLILSGLMKKMFISDYISVNFIDRVFSNPLSYGGFENLMALYGYSLQVYADFAGYTDIAIGVALLMGYRLPVNFNSPYKAQNVGEFWKRWHISLSSWLKDYLYIPLGGNKRGKLMTNVNLMITMLLGGLWHGASWQFVIWGGLNGLGIVFYKYWKKISPFASKNNWAVRFYAIFFTFNFITFTRIWFRAQTMETANNIIHQIVNNFNFLLIPQMIVSYKYVFGIMLFGYVVHWLSDDFKNKYKKWFVDSPVYVKLIIVVIVVFIVYQAKSSELQPFIYFQF